MHGKGSQIAVDNLNNILTITRAKEWSYIFVSPRFIDLDVCHFCLETMVMDFEQRRNMVMMYDGLGTALGRLWIPLIDQPEWSSYKYQMKMENIDKILDSGGWVSFENYEKYSEDKEKSFEVDPYRGQLDDIRAALYQQLTRYGVSPRDLEIFQLWVEGSTTRDIGPIYNIDQSAVSKITSKVRREVLGYAFEDVIYALKKTDSLNWFQGGKNSPDPDLQNDVSKEIISVKCYADKKRSVTIPREELAKSELDLFHKGYKLTILFYNVCWNQLFEFPVQGDEERFSFRQR